MTIDEAIANEREVAKRNRILLDSDELVQKSYDAYFDKLKCEKCAEEHEQLAEWLEELKVYQQHEIICHEGYNAGYNKAIDDFAEKAIKIVYEANNRDRNPQPRDMVADIHYKLLEIAEQLKVGEKE